MTPQELNQHMQSAVQLHQSGLLDQAEVKYRKALNHFPRNADILNLLGAVCSQKGEHIEGIKYLKRALRIHPDHPNYLLNLGEAQTRSGKHHEAIKAFKKVLLKQPQFALAHYNLANLYKIQHYFEAAVQHYKEAIQLEPRRAEYYYNLANTLREIGHMRSALNAYQQAVQLNPGHAEAHNNLGTVMLEWDRYDEAQQHFQTAIDLKPDFDSAYNNLLQYYESNGESQKAKDTVKKIRHLHPDNPYLELAEANIFPIIPQSQAEIDDALQQLDATCDRLMGQSFDFEQVSQYNLAPPSIMTYYGRDDKAIREKYARLFIQALDLKPQPLNFKNIRPHLGFVVTKGHEGVFLKCMTGLIQNLPNRYQVSIICSLPNGKTILSEKLPDLDYIELLPNIQQAAEQVRAAQFDLLHYWEIGTDAMNYFLPFFKAAKYQVTSWGWPVTSGLPHLDAYMSCQYLETPESDRHYSEPLLRLKRMPIYYAPPPVPTEPANRSDFGFTDKQNLYFCAQNLRKIQPDMDPIFAQILSQDARAMIVLIEDKRQAITDLLKQRLKNNLPAALFERIRIVPRMEAEVYLGLVKAADVMLDSTNYTGGANTNYDAFEAGTPVITMPGTFHRGRYTTAAYTQMGYTDLIAENPEDFVKKAIQIATDTQARAKASAAIQMARSEVIEDTQAVQIFCDAIDHLIKHNG